MPAPDESLEYDEVGGRRTVYAQRRFRCSDECATSANGLCEDGGRFSLGDTCLPGTDCADCIQAGLSRFEPDWDELGELQTWLLYADWLGGCAMLCPIFGFLGTCCACFSRRKIKKAQRDERRIRAQLHGAKKKKKRKWWASCTALLQNVWRRRAKTAVMDGTVGGAAIDGGDDAAEPLLDAKPLAPAAAELAATGGTPRSSTPRASNTNTTLDREKQRLMLLLDGDDQKWAESILDDVSKEAREAGVKPTVIAAMDALDACANALDVEAAVLLVRISEVSAGFPILMSAGRSLTNAGQRAMGKAPRSIQANGGLSVRHAESWLMLLRDASDALYTVLRYALINLGRLLRVVAQTMQAIFDVTIVMSSFALVSKVFDALPIDLPDALPRIDSSMIAFNLMFNGFRPVVLFDSPFLTWLVPYLKELFQMAFSFSFVFYKMPGERHRVTPHPDTHTWRYTAHGHGQGTHTCTCTCTCTCTRMHNLTRMCLPLAAVVDDCKGFYGIFALLMLMLLMWPLFQLLQLDLLTQLKVKAAGIDWHLMPRQQGGRLLRVYRRFQKGAAGRMVWQGWMSGWSSACAGLSNLLSLCVQIMTLAMCTRLVELTALFRRTEYAELLVGAGLLPQSYMIPSECGQIEQDLGLTAADSFAATFIFVIWMGFLVWPTFFFFVPMLFASRDEEDWHMSSFLRPVIRPDARNHLVRAGRLPTPRPLSTAPERTARVI